MPQASRLWRWAASTTTVLGMVVALLFAPAVATAAQPDFPALTGRLVDQADLLDANVEQDLTRKLAALETQTSDQLIVVTVSSLQDQEIEEYGYRLGRAWGIGQKEGDNGALLIVAPNERKVRIEVGYGLEPVLTDAFSSQVIRNEMLPAFRDGDFPSGITRGVDALIQQLTLDPAEAQARAAAAAEAEEPASAEAILPIIIIGFIFVIFLLSAIGAGGGGRRRRRDGVAPILIWAAAEALKGSGRSNGGWGGGGFSGGGGSFGGGGASGGW